MKCVTFTYNYFLFVLIHPCLGNVSDVVESTEDTGASAVQPQASALPPPLTNSSQPQGKAILCVTVMISRGLPT